MYITVNSNVFDSAPTVSHLSAGGYVGIFFGIPVGLGILFCAREFSEWLELHMVWRGPESDPEA
jgi:hypothetical protein